jgi:hypothetical protein
MDLSPEFVELIGDLYQLPPTEFVAARSALARRLKDEQRRDDAQAVQRLARPSQAAWLLNRLAQEDPLVIDDVIKAGRELRKAQMALMGEGGAERLRAAQKSRRALLMTATDKALKLGGASNKSQARAVGDVLEAASVDDEVAAALRSGVLATGADAPSGLDGLGDFSPPPRSIEGGQDSNPGASPAVVSVPSTPTSEGTTSKSKATERVAREAAEAAAAGALAASRAKEARDASKRVEELEEQMRTREEELSLVRRELAVARRQEAEANRAAERATRHVR